MKNLKKHALILSLVCLALVLLFSITACGNTTNDKTQPTTTNAPTTETEEKCPHTASEWVIDKNASCTEEGKKHKECSACKATLESETIPTTNHIEEIVPGKAATCAESGLTDGKRCSVCKKTLVEQSEIVMLAHSEEIVDGISPTCTEAGLTSGKKCSKCGQTLLEQETIEAVGHTESDWIIDKVADVGVDGAKHTECTACNIIIRTEAIPAIEETHIHEAKEWVVTTPATCTQTGVKHLICDCGEALESAAIESIPHTETIIPAKAATCTSTGLTEGKKCLVCEKVLVAQTVIAQVAHSEETVLGTAPTCTASGLSDGKKCSVCTTITVSQTIIPPTGHSFKNGTCQACGIVEPYGIWIVDGLGNPVTDVIVKVMKDDEQIKMYPYKGEFLSMNVELGTYRIILDLSQISEEYTYDESVCILTPENRTTTIRLFKTATENDSLYVGYPIDSDYDSYRITEGSTLVTLTPNDYTFFVFAPSTAAIYTVTYECTTNLTISYHGGSFFVQGNDLTDVSGEVSRYENGISLNIYPSNIGGEYVLAVRSTSATSCVINIKNAGDPGTRIEDAPWTPYLEDSARVEEQLSISANASGTYTNVDLGNLSLKAVYNEEDGYYHLNSVDGPILFIDLTSDAQFVASIQTICGYQRMGAYIYDVNGNIVEKRSYNELFHQYGMPTDAETSVESAVRVPLTEKLAEAIKCFGEKNGWWEPNSDSNIFTSVMLGAPYNQEFAWLLYCGYYN